MTTKGTGIPAMLLPAAPFPPVDGLKVYAAEPALQNHFDSRTDQLLAVRVDQATFMAITPGDYVLPAMEVQWWDALNSKVARSRIDAVRLRVVVGPASQQTPSVGETAHEWSVLAFVRENKVLIGCGILVLLGMAWIWRASRRSVITWFRRQREAYLASEAWSFRRLHAAARHHIAREVYSALLDWVQHFEPLAASRSLAGLIEKANDRDLDAEVAALASELFGPHLDTQIWSARGLMRRVGAARRRLRVQSTSGARSSFLLPELNPTGAAHDLRASLWQPVAR